MAGDNYQAQIDYYCAYWRRKVAAGDMSLADLKTLADSLYSIADAEVTITSTGFEGGNTTAGVINVPKWAIGAALESIIAELDPDNTPASPSMAQGASFGHRCVEV